NIVSRVMMVTYSFYTIIRTLSWRAAPVTALRAFVPSRALAGGASDRVTRFCPFAGIGEPLQ
ncbi:hypothetical protein, partial [Siminovitchia fortis]